MHPSNPLPQPGRGRRTYSPEFKAQLVAEQAVRQIAQIYAVEREVKELSAEVGLCIRQEKSQPLVQTL